MAIAVEMTFKGATLDQYDQVIEAMGLEPGGASPPGAISHWAAALVVHRLQQHKRTLCRSFSCFERHRMSPS